MFNKDFNLLQYQLSPAAINEKTLWKAEAIALTVVKNFKSAGIFAVEMFIDKDDNDNDGDGDVDIVAILNDFAFGVERNFIRLRRSGAAHDLSLNSRHWRSLRLCHRRSFSGGVGGKGSFWGLRYLTISVGRSRSLLVGPYPAGAACGGDAPGPQNSRLDSKCHYRIQQHNAVPEARSLSDDSRSGNG